MRKLKVCQISLALVAGLGLSQLQQKVTSPVQCGTHAPQRALNTWRVVTGGCASAFPIQRVYLEKPGCEREERIIFLTARHVAARIPLRTILQSYDKRRKFMITAKQLHPVADIALFWAQPDPGAKIPLVPLALDLKREAGLSVWSVGYPGPFKRWYVSRGYLDASGKFGSFHVIPGMSGGPLLTNKGEAIGVLEGYGALERDDPTKVHQKDGPEVGGFYETDLTFETGAYVAVADHRAWLKTHGVTAGQ